MLELIVLRCRDLAAARRFYAALGLGFVDEQHGDGPAHHAAASGGVVVELYPLEQGEEPGRDQLGFSVPDVAGAVAAALAAGGVVRSAGEDRAVLLDPDGRTVRLRRSRGDERSPG